MSERFRLSPVAVGKAMHHGVIVCRPDTLSFTVARMMAAHRVHSVLVVDDAGTCVGIVRDTEIEEALFAGTLATGTAKDIAVEPVFVASGDSVEAALRRMHEQRTTHAVVANSETKHPVGVLSMIDVVDVVAEGGAP